MANALRVAHQPDSNFVPDARGYVALPQDPDLSPIPAIAVGETLFQRFYFRNDIRDSVNAPANMHGIQAFGDLELSPPYVGSRTATLHWLWKWGSGTNGQFPWRFEFQQSDALGGSGWGGGAFFNDYGYPGLQKGRVYLMEIAFTRTGPTSFAVNTRLDGVNANSLYQSGGGPFSPFGSANTDIRLEPDALRTFFVGNNDAGNTFPGSDPTLDFVYVGGVAVAVRNDSAAAAGQFPMQWIGPYEAGRGW
jgi:hypothetical protein